MAKKEQQDKKAKKVKPKKRPAVAKRPPKTQVQRSAEKQALAMWALLGEGGAAYGGKVKPEVEKAEREALKREGYIDIEKRERGAFWLEVTDKGWNWAEQNLDVPLPEKTFGGAFVLRAWLSRLRVFLKANDLRLSDVFSPQSSPVKISAPVKPQYAELREQIRAAYRDVAGGFNRRALLSDLRAKLDGIDRGSLDEALARMHFEEGAMLMTLDNPQEITPADRAATLNLRGEPMHVLWIIK